MEGPQDVLVHFKAFIALTVEEVRDAGGDLDQAVQNAIGCTGAQVSS